MKTRLAAALIVLVATHLPAQSTPPTQELRDAFPADAKADQFALSPDGLRTYFVNAAGEVWLYDRTRKSRARIAGGGISELNLSPARDALAYTKVAGARGDAQVWVLRLNPETGLATGTEHQLSTSSGDAPSISPDGKFVAFARDDATGVGQSIVVVTINGGAERVVAPALPSSVGNIRWTPDGKRLFFGVNPPVACVPEWSCLPLSGANRQPPGSIRRVAIGGGPVTVVATARGVFPGLSPDGSTLMYIDTGSTRRWVVADANGQHRNAITLPSAQSATGWFRGSTLLISSSGNARSLRVQSLAGGHVRTLMDGADLALDPAWSPDGKLISIMARAARAELRILNADGLLQRTLPLPDNFAAYSAWSPDQRYIAFMAFAENTPPHMSVVDIATGRVQRLSDVGQENSPSMRWQADSRGLVISEMLGAGKDRHATFRQVDLTGKSTLLRDIALGPVPGLAVAIDATSALVLRGKPADVRLVRLSDDTAERVIERLDTLERAGLVSMPMVSADGVWYVMRRNATNAAAGQASALDVARVDGLSATTMPLPFIVAGGNTLRILPGGKELVVTEAPRPDLDPGVYAVTVATHATRKLFTYAPRFGPPELSLSPDGRSLLYLLWQTLPPTLYTMDASSWRGGNNK